ncbi:MAG TPA: N-formylglutamate amidohydrolase, partial [Parvularculaceae bacterium]|nr:N-formylglutamate amidohydrolase [Parvularculaceae bacterium]
PVDMREGSGPFVVVCEHASNRLPRALGTLGLSAADLDRHIAWDPGAAEIATGLGRALDATVVLQRYSRLARLVGAIHVGAIVLCDPSQHSCAVLIKIIFQSHPKFRDFADINARQGGTRTCGFAAAGLGCFAAAARRQSDKRRAGDNQSLNSTCHLISFSQ